MLVTKKKMGEFSGYLGEIIAIQQKSIETQNEALTHLGNAVSDLTALVQLQNTRLDSLEEHNTYKELIGKTFKGDT